MAIGDEDGDGGSWIFEVMRAIGSILKKIAVMVFHYVDKNY